MHTHGVCTDAFESIPFELGYHDNGLYSAALPLWEGINGDYSLPGEMATTEAQIARILRCLVH